MEKETDWTRSLDSEAINPPRLEDAGLEDCALPLESILEAFSKAASITSISRFSNSVDDAVDEEDEGSEVVDQIEDGGQPSPVQEVNREEGQEEKDSTGGETLLMRTGEEECAEADEKK